MHAKWLNFTRRTAVPSSSSFFAAMCGTNNVTSMKNHWKYDFLWPTKYMQNNKGIYLYSIMTYLRCIGYVKLTFGVVCHHLTSCSHTKIAIFPKKNSDFVIWNFQAPGPSMKSLAKSFKIPKRISSYSSQFSPKISFQLHDWQWFLKMFFPHLWEHLQQWVDMAGDQTSRLVEGAVAETNETGHFSVSPGGTPLKCIAYMYVIENIHIYIYVLMMDEILVNNDVTICLVINCNLCRISTMSIQSQRQHERQRGEEKFSFYRSLERLRR